MYLNREHQYLTLELHSPQIQKKPAYSSVQYTITEHENILVIVLGRGIQRYIKYIPISKLLGYRKGFQQIKTSNSLYSALWETSRGAMGADWKKAYPSLEEKESICEVLLEELCISWVLKDELYLDKGDYKNKAGSLAWALCCVGIMSYFGCLDRRMVWQTRKEKRL